MKSKHFQKAGLSKYHNGQTTTKIHRDLNGRISLRKIKRWWQMICQFGSIILSSPPDGPRFARTKGNIQKVKHRLRRKKRVSARKLSMDLHISDRSVRRIMKNDLGLRPYKKVIEPLLSNDQKIKRKNICKLDSNKFSKRGHYENSLFRWEILLTLMVSIILKTIECRQEIVMMPIKRVALSRNENFPRTQWFVWLGVCSKGITLLVILDEGIVDHTVYI